MEPLGVGTYGVVVSAIDTSDTKSEDNCVAIKKISKSFEHRVFALRMLREMKVLRLLDHENIISIKTILMPESLESMNELYMVTDLMETDLF